TTWYWPVSSVTTERTFSISAGLDASTVTPGSTAPDASLTTPAIVAWAYVTAGVKAITAIHRHRVASFASARMSISFWLDVIRADVHPGRALACSGTGGVLSRPGHPSRTHERWGGRAAPGRRA